MSSPSICAKAIHIAPYRHDRDFRIFAAVIGLCRRKDADCSDISAQGSGAYGVVLLYAALVDPRFTHVAVDHALASYRSVVDTRLHRGVSESILPGALPHFDLPDVVAAPGKRVTVTNPIAAGGEVSGDR